MKCAECGEDRFVEIETQHTLLGFVTDINSRHHHDPNTWCTIFECKNGHRIEIDYKVGCPMKDCDFNRSVA